ncbi:MAG: phenylalanine--tRNA ligase subunit alpha [Candidatus Babeliaceae bacterium]|nr:phenylalanine--tRNA ligase subunit alpha [Candidatus Babeliaceae bacterium]
MEYTHPRLQAIAQDYYQQLSAAQNRNDVENIRISFIGRNGAINTLMVELKKASLEEKRTLGPELNDFKKQAQAAFEKKVTEFETAERTRQEARSDFFDVTAYRPGIHRGSLHPQTRLCEKLENILTSMGFELLDGPEAETEEINFSALNIPHDHPARDMQDTFWLTLPERVMRTHTSAVQVRGIRSHGAPCALASIGRCYRSEATDASHDFIFSQFEALLIDKKVSLSHLIATIRAILQAVFEKENLDIRVRPSYFPFVEPGLEVDMSCPFCTAGCSVCKKSRWIEMGGAGLIHPNVLRACNIDPREFSGFALGFGLTRLVMLSYGIPDIRLLHSGKIEFLKQF